MYCLSPWSELSLHCSGYAKVGCCAFSGRPFDFEPGGPIDIQAIWNSDFFQRLRTMMGNNDLENSGCEKCELAINDIRPTLVPHHVLNDRQQANYDAVMASYSGKDAVVDAYPLKYQFNFSSSCNIRCIMCNQHDARDAHFNDEALSANALLDCRDALSRALSINISGGEPLFSRECLIFLEALCTDDDLIDVELDMVTNGLLLPKVYHLLERKKHLSLNISLDGIGDSHEYVRKGSNWKKLSGIIDELVSMRDRLSKTGWRLGSEFIPMKSNLHHLLKYIEFCLERDMNPGILFLHPTRNTADEDLLHNTSLLDELVGWEGWLEKACELLDVAGKHDIAESLYGYRTALADAKAGKSEVPPVYSQGMVNDVLANPEALYGKKVMIWGVGGNYRYCLAGWLNDNLEFIDFLGFVSGWEDHWGTRCDGFPVYSPDQVAALRPDVIIIAANQVWRLEIMEEIRKIKTIDPLLV